MTGYDRVLYFDSDCLVVGSINELLSMDMQAHPLWVTRDIRGGKWVDGFNMGVFMIKPSIDEFRRLVKDKDDPTVQYETMMSEQGFLNVIYKDTWGDFGFSNNANLAAYSDDPVLWRQQETDGINVIHYTMNKPWDCGPAYKTVCALWHTFDTGAE